MFAQLGWVVFGFHVAVWRVAAQEGTGYQFTMPASPAPVPGQPYTLTWTGGLSDESVYIILNYYFPDTPNQLIPYIMVDILSNAPNNGSWTYDIPGNITPGRYSFSIGENPILQSATSAVFTVTASEISGSPALPGPPPTTNTAFQTYNGCGLPPLPDYTYTGYQAPCTTTANGVVETLYPNVPVSASSSFFGSSYLNTAPPTNVATPSSTNIVSSSSTLVYDTAFATGVFAQALQCPTPVTPSMTRITAAGATTIFSLVGCTTNTGSSSQSGGACHTSGYSTFSVSGTSSVCCPGGWATTPLNSELFCFTSVGQAQKRGAAEERQVSTETLEASPSTLIAIDGLAFTSAGIVTNEAAGSPSTGGTSATTSVPSAMGSAASPSPTKGTGLKLSAGVWGILGMVMAIVIL